MKAMNGKLPLFSSAIFDSERLVEAISGASLDCRQLSRQPAASFLGRVACPRMTLDLAEIGTAMEFRGVMPSDAYTIIFVSACPTPGRSFNFGVEHRDGMIGFFPPGGALDAYTPEGYANTTLTVPVAEFEAQLALVCPEIPASVLARGCAMRVGIAEQARLRDLMAGVRRSLEDEIESLAEQNARCRLVREVFMAFLSAFRSGLEEAAPRSTLRLQKRFQRLVQLREFVSAHLHEPLYLDELCEAAELSERGVQKLFHDLLDIEPCVYLRHHRMHGARRDLRNGDTGPGVIKEAAIKWGFSHMGRFSSEYRVLFGELPSETLSSRS
jgi:AraC-like DNA-binding protein